MGARDVLAQGRHLGRQLAAASRPFAQPERDRGGRAARVLDPHPARLDPPDAPGGVSQQHDVAGHRLDREVLVQRADQRPLGLEDHVVVGVVGDRAAGGQRGQARPAPPAQAPVHGVPVEQRARTARGWSRSPRPACRRRRRSRRAAAPRKGRPARTARTARPRPIRRWRRRRPPAARGRPAARGASATASSSPRRAARTQRGALDQLVTRQREQPPLGGGRQRVPGAPDPLQAGGDRPRRADQAAELDRPDVDPQLQRGRGDDDLQVARLQQPLGPVAALFREAAVVRGDGVLPQPLGQVQGHPLDQPPRVDEHQRRVMRPRQVGDAIVELGPLLVRGHRAQLVLGHQDAQVQVAPLADVDDGRQRPRRPDQQAGGHVQRPHGGGQADPLEAAAEPPGARAVRSTAPGARRACPARRRGSRRGPRSGRRAGPAAPNPRSAG